MRVGFVGIGNMGGPLAERLLGKVTLAVCDRDSERVAAFVARGAEACASPGDVAARVDVVLTCLPASKDVDSVIFADDGIASGAQPGTLIADMTTGDPNMTRDMASRLAPQQIELIDAPVSGGPRGAREGTIAIMVGGNDAQFSRLKPILDHISVNVLHAGDVGAGHAIKAGNNLLNLICRIASFEVVSLLVKDGVDPAKAVGIIQKSSGRNYSTEITLPDNILSGKMFQGFTTALMTKDAGVALDIAKAHDIEMPLGTAARATLQQTIDEFGLDADMSQVALTYERLTGARISPRQ